MQNAIEGPSCIYEATPGFPVDLSFISYRWLRAKLYSRKVTFYRPLIVPYPSAWHEGTASITRTKNGREREINESDGAEFDFLRFCATAGKYAYNDKRVTRVREREESTGGIYFVIMATEWGPPIKSRLGTRFALIKATIRAVRENLCIRENTYPIENFHIWMYKYVDRESESGPVTRQRVDRLFGPILRADASRRQVNRCHESRHEFVCYDCSIASPGDICERRPMNLGQFGNCLGRLPVIATGNWNRGLQLRWIQIWIHNRCMRLSYIFVSDNGNII